MLLNRNTFPFLYTVVVSRNDIRGKNQPRYILRTWYDSIQKLNDLPSLMEAEKSADAWHARFVELSQTYKELLERYDKNQALLETAQNTILKLSEQIKKESASQCSQR